MIEKEHKSFQFIKVLQHDIALINMVKKSLVKVVLNSDLMRACQQLQFDT